MPIRPNTHALLTSIADYRRSTRCPISVLSQLIMSRYLDCSQTELARLVGTLQQPLLRRT